MVAERRRSMAVGEMTDSLQRVGERPLELSVEERNLLSVAYGSTAGCHRAAWHIITSVSSSTGCGGTERVLQGFLSGQVQWLENPAVPLAEIIVELPVIQKEKTRQGVNVCVQHVVNTVEVENYVVQEKIFRETERIQIPLLQYMDKAIDIIVVAQRQISMVIDARVVSVV